MERLHSVAALARHCQTARLAQDVEREHGAGAKDVVLCDAALVVERVRVAHALVYQGAFVAGRDPGLGFKMLIERAYHFDVVCGVLEELGQERSLGPHGRAVCLVHRDDLCYEGVGQDKREPRNGLTVLARRQQARLPKARVHALQVMDAREQVRVLLDEWHRETPTGETGDPLPLLFAADGRAGVDLCELEIEHALEGDAVRGRNLEKVVSTVPHDLFQGGVCEEVEDVGEGGGGACSECEDVEDEDVLGVGGADAHEGEDAVRGADVLALAVDDEEGRPGENLGGMCDGGCVDAVGVSGGHGVMRHTRLGSYPLSTASTATIFDGKPFLIHHARPYIHNRY